MLLNTTDNLFSPLEFDVTGMVRKNWDRNDTMIKDELQ